MAYTWEPPPPRPPPGPLVVTAVKTFLRIFVPLLLLLPLFLLRWNRPGAAWWLWVPLGITAVVGLPVVWLTTDGDQEMQAFFWSFVVGLAAVWLLTPLLESRFRIVASLKTLVLLAFFCAAACVSALVSVDSAWSDFWPNLASLLGCGSVVVVLALTLAGFCGRRRFGRLRFLIWLTLGTVLAWGVIMPSVIYVIASGLGAELHWGEAAVGVLVISTLTLVLLLPLVLLSFFQPLYRARFFAWLKLPQLAPPAEPNIPPRLAELAHAPPK